MNGATRFTCGKGNGMLSRKGGRGDPVGKKRTRWKFGNGAHVYLRTNASGSQSWGIEFRDENKNRVQQIIKNAMSLEDAKTVLYSRLREVFDCQNGIVKPKKISFGEFAERFLRDYARTEKKSWKTDLYRMRNLKKTFGEMELSQLTTQHLRDYRASRIENGTSPLTTNREMALLKKMFNWAKEEGLALQNPVQKIKFFSETDSIRNRVLSSEEEARLLDAITTHSKPIVLVALHTGLRYREILGLTWEDLDIEHRAIRVQHTKSKKARFIPMNSILVEIFSKLKGIMKHPVRVFPFNDIRKGFLTALERAAISNFTFHDLRRTFGTRLLEKGLDIISISRLYGHSSVLVTERYLHPRDTRTVEALEMLVENSPQSSLLGKKLQPLCGIEKESAKSESVTPPYSVN